MAKKSRIQTKLEAHFGIEFHEIVKKYFKTGMSRYQCSEQLTKMTKGEIIVRHSTFWNMTQEALKSGKLTRDEFDFKGKQRCGRRRKKKKEEAPAIPTEANLKCKKCNHETKVDMGPDYLCFLRVKQCEGCESYGHYVAKFTEGEKVFLKAVVDKKEVFVDHNLKITEEIPNGQSNPPNPEKVKQTEATK